MHGPWPWLALALLGAFHGLNPGMGWLFAVALGLQERSRVALLRAFGPIALGHAASVAAVVAIVVIAQPFVATEVLRKVGAVVLIAFGGYKLIRRAHPRWVAMRVGPRDLAAWSFLMATAHGAGLMLVPLLLLLPGGGSPHEAHLAPIAAVVRVSAASSTAPAGVTDCPSAHDHAAHDPATHAAALAQPCVAPAPSTPAMSLSGAALGAVALHTGAMFLAMAGLALLVYERLGLAVLRRGWINLDLIWAGSLIAAGGLAFVL